MGNRLSKIYTRTGDDGSTGLADGSRVAKLDPRIEAMGAVDELSSQLGILLALPEAEGCDDELRAILLDVQHDLFDLGAELSLPGEELLPAARSTWLEQQMDELNASLPPLKNFILPGGSPSAAHCHLARAVCRRAERRLLALAESESASAAARCYLNRLSDFLFILARILARREGGSEVLWRQRGRDDNDSGGN